MSLAAALPGSLRAVCPVGRGGLIPAAIVAYARDIPALGHLPVPPATIGFRDLKDVLIIDDIVDSGETFRVIRRLFPGAIYAAPYVKPQGRVYCDYWMEEVPQDLWLQFPWGPSE
jgi:xanthine phosphoribosyltransferase